MQKKKIMGAGRVSEVGSESRYGRSAEHARERDESLEYQDRTTTFEYSNKSKLQTFDTSSLQPSMKSRQTNDVSSKKDKKAKKKKKKERDASPIGGGGGGGGQYDADVLLNMLSQRGQTGQVDLKKMTRDEKKKNKKEKKS